MKKTIKNVHTFCYKNSAYKIHQAQIFQILKSGLRIMLRIIHLKYFFSNDIPSKYKNIHKELQGRVMSIPWFLNIMSAVGHNIELIWNNLRIKIL